MSLCEKNSYDTEIYNLVLGLLNGNIISETNLCVKRNLIIDYIENREIDVDKLLYSMKELGFLEAVGTKFVDFSRYMVGRFPSINKEIKEKLTNEENGMIADNKIPPISLNDGPRRKELEGIVAWFIAAKQVTQDKLVVDIKVLNRAVDFNYQKWHITLNQLIDELQAYGFLDCFCSKFCTFSVNIFAMMQQINIPPIDDQSSILVPSEFSDGFTENCNPAITSDVSFSLEIVHNLTFRRKANSEFTVSSKNCIVCRLSFQVQMQLETHMRETHGNKFKIPREVAKDCYRIDFKSLAELPPDIRENGLLSLRKVRSDGSYIEPIEAQFLMRIKRVERDHLVVRQNYTVESHYDRRGKRRQKKFDPNALYNIRIKDNRVPILMEHQALQMMKKQKLAKFLIPTVAPTQKEMTIKNFEWFNPNIQTNPEQMQAVRQIVNGTAYPSPYIIFGPPGTGKTMTIVETVCQLWKMIPTSRILVTAQSNSACDEIVKRLLKILPASDIHRFYTPSYEKKMDLIDEKLLEISNLKTGQHQYLGYDEFYWYRVVACTLCTAGHLVLADINPRHFTHVFIDECASATEASSLIPIAGLITANDTMFGHIILAGDTQQLGPILKTPFAVYLGYDKPLMQRLMELPIYQKDSQTKKLNPNLITKLIRSFRSHRKIMEFSNKTFYDGDLLAKGLPESTDWAINWRKLPKPNFPIIFEPCFGASKKDDTTNSTYNNHQIAVILRYLSSILTTGINRRKIVQSEIGIISPYKKQCLLIAQKCRINRWPDIEVGTVENFQGREKPIIIVSTVRSGMGNVGFLNNPKRLNVTITRAKALIIIIGNPETLRHDPYWYDLIKFCKENGGCTQKVNIGKRPVNNPAVYSGAAEFNYHLKLGAKDQNIFVGDFL